MVDLTPVKCPECKSENVWHTEMIPIDRRVYGLRPDGTLEVAAWSDPDYESCQDETLLCKDCMHEWELPEKVEYVG